MQATTAETMRGGGRPASEAAFVIDGHDPFGEPAWARGRSDRPIRQPPGELEHVRSQCAEQHDRRRHVADVEPADHREPATADVGRLAAQQRQQRLEVLPHELGGTLVRHAQSAFDHVRV